jgi:hypothetical protein
VSLHLLPLLFGLRRCWAAYRKFQPETVHMWDKLQSCQQVLARLAQAPLRPSAQPPSNGK